MPRAPARAIRAPNQSLRFNLDEIAEILRHGGRLSAIGAGVPIGEQVRVSRVRLKVAAGMLDWTEMLFGACGNFCYIRQ